MFDIKLGEGVGDIKLGMHMHDVRALFDDLQTVTDTPYGYPYEVTTITTMIFRYTMTRTAA